MLEGPAGAGKMELATSVSRAYGIPLLRLQCYQGINEEKAIGQYDKSLQELYVLLMSKSDHTPDWAEIKRKVTSRAYFMAGPLLEAIEQKQPCVLLIDEIDKVDYAFEAMLLELLSAWTLSIHKMGTVHPTSIPYVFLTSNQERRLGKPRTHPGRTHWIEHLPTLGTSTALTYGRHACRSACLSAEGCRWAFHPAPALLCAPDATLRSAFPLPSHCLPVASLRIEPERSRRLPQPQLTRYNTELSF